MVELVPVIAVTWKGHCFLLTSLTQYLAHSRYSIKTALETIFEVESWNKCVLLSIEEHTAYSAPEKESCLGCFYPVSDFLGISLICRPASSGLSLSLFASMSLYLGQGLLLKSFIYLFLAGSVLRTISVRSVLKHFSACIIGWLQLPFTL